MLWGTGTPTAAFESIPQSPIFILKNPFSPQFAPHEFWHIQYLVPFDTPYPMITTACPPKELPLTC